MLKCISRYISAEFVYLFRLIYLSSSGKYKKRLASIGKLEKKFKLYLIRSLYRVIILSFLSASPLRGFRRTQTNCGGTSVTQLSAIINGEYLLHLIFFFFPSVFTLSVKVINVVQEKT